MTTTHSIRTAPPAPAGAANAGAATAGRAAAGGPAPGAFSALLSSLGASPDAEQALSADAGALDAPWPLAHPDAETDSLGESSATAELGAPNSDLAAAESATAMLLQGMAGVAAPAPTAAGAVAGAQPGHAVPGAAGQAPGTGDVGSLAAAVAPAGAAHAGPGGAPAAVVPASPGGAASQVLGTRDVGSVAAGAAPAAAAQARPGGVSAAVVPASPGGASALAATQKAGAAAVAAGPGGARADGGAALQTAALAQERLGQVPSQTHAPGPAATAEEAAAVQALGAAGASGTGVGLVAQTVRMDAGAETAPGGASRTQWQRPAAARPAAPAGASRNGAAQTWAQAQEPVLGKTQAAVAGAARADAQAGLAAAPAPAPAGTPALPELSVAGGVGAGGLTEQAAALVQTMVASGWVAEARPGRGPGPAGERLSVPDAAPGQGWAGPGAAALPDAAGTPAAGLAPSAEDAVAEQVTYWLNDNLKNAELTLDHAGQPVDVRVSIVGNEAHVAFRSDQAQTRELLAARMDQLRDLLNAEGLVLTGSSVDAGASGQNGARGGREAPAGAPTTQVRAAGEVAAPAPRRSLGSGAVDLYV